MISKLHLSLILLISFVFYVQEVLCQNVVINEICTSPPGIGTTNANSMYNTAELPSDNQEWIELYNPNPCDSVDISCYTIGGNMLQTTSNGPAPNWGAFTFPSGTFIPPMGFIIIGGNHSQVPILEFNTTAYRQSSFGVQYLDGDSVRWFLRDEYGWVALYDPSATVVDAVYWDAYGVSSNLFSAGEYQHNIVTHTTCSGTQTLTAARNIAGIEYVGATIAGTYLSFQRVTDGSPQWKSDPSTPTPHICNGPCAVPPVISHVSQNEHCNSGDGSISITNTDGHTGPYTTNWINPAGLHTTTVNNLHAGTYIVQVVDAYNCFMDYDTITITNIQGPDIQIDSIRNEMCSAEDGAIYTSASQGTQPYTYTWSSNPPQYSQNLTNVHAYDYTVTLTDSYGCTATTDTAITNTPPPVISFDNIQADTCNKNTGYIHVVAIGGHPPYSYTWSTGPDDHKNVISHLNEGTYNITVTDSTCSTTSSVFITGIPGPKADFQFYPPVALIDDPTFRFEDWSLGSINQWHWDFGDSTSTTIQNPFHTYGSIGTYDVTLKIKNDFGCRDSVTKQAIVIDKPALYIPNCFTPNGDGINDAFFVVGLNVSDLKFYLYDRWGEMVYSSFSLDDRWNGHYKGRVLPNGVYDWVVFYNENYAGIRIIPKEMKGVLTVLR
jgi:gliding motility-associated-like protein